MAFTGDDSARNRSRAVDSVLLKLCLKYAAALGEEYCKILCVHDSLFMVVLDCPWYLVVSQGAHKASAVFTPACQVSTHILS